MSQSPDNLFAPLPEQPLVSFVIPAYNYGRYLSDCLQSMLNQTYQHFHIAILDDGSSDNTPELAQSWCEKDSRITYHRHQQNIGPVANWNSCLAAAKGELVWLISADDCLADNTLLERLVKAFQAHPKLALAFCRAQLMHQDNALIDKFIPKQGAKFPDDAISLYAAHDFFKKIAQENFVPVLGTLARKSLYDKIGGFDAELIHTGDWFNWIRMSLWGDVFYDPRPSVWYRQHTTNLSQNYSNKAYPVENTLLSYQKLRAYIRENDLPAKLLAAVDLAEARFKRKKGQPMAFGEKVQYQLGKLLGEV